MVNTTIQMHTVHELHSNVIQSPQNVISHSLDYRHQITLASFRSLSNNSATDATRTPGTRLGGSSTERISNLSAMSTPSSCKASKDRSILEASKFCHRWMAGIGAPPGNICQFILSKTCSETNSLINAVLQ